MSDLAACCLSAAFCTTPSQEERTMYTSKAKKISPFSQESV